MWYDEINKKSEQAADESNSPAYNDKAWEKMELLLDKHLPLKKKRRLFIFLLLPLILAGTAGIFILQKRNSDKKIIVEQKNNSVQASTSIDKPINKKNELDVTISKKDNTASIQSLVKPATEISLTETRSQNQPGGKQIQGLQTKQYKDLNSQKDEQAQYSSKKMPAKKTDEGNNDFDRNNPVSTTKLSIARNNELKNISTVSTAIDSLSTQKTIDSAGKNLADTSETKNALLVINPEKKKFSSLNNLSLNISFGPDISSVGTNKPGKLTMQYGAGISYVISQKFTIRTGFFAVSKLYTADSADYDPPANFWSYYPNLQKIDANCLVYEIPLSLVYNFTTSKKYNWFISGGLSSYIMKKEVYNYSYKNAWGQPQSYKKTHYNENTHLFSVINISGGYQYHFTHSFSIMVEPYIKIPASGMGFGNVKLNSGGILFTAGFKPFLNK